MKALVTGGAGFIPHHLLNFVINTFGNVCLEFL